MKFRVDTTDLTRAIGKLDGAGEQIRKDWEAAATDIGTQAVGFIVRTKRSGPTSLSTTQVRTNRLRASYGEQVRRVGSHGVELDVGLLRSSASAEALVYGRLIEGFNEDGSQFTSKVIKAKGGGWLTFPIFPPDTPGTSKENIVGWVRVKQMTFRPRRSFPAVRVKFEPLLRTQVQAVLERVMGSVGQ